MPEERQLPSLPPLSLDAFTEDQHHCGDDGSRVVRVRGRQASERRPREHAEKRSAQDHLGVCALLGAPLERMERGERVSEGRIVAMGNQETLRSLHERLVGDLSRREHPLAGEAQAPEQAQQGIRPAPRRGALAWEDSVGWRGRRSHAFVVEQRVILDEARVRALASSRTDIRGGTAPRR